MHLSKSEYMMFLKHPAWLWVKKHDKDKIPEPDANLQAIFDAGHDFEEYANKRFPDGVDIGFNSYPEYLSMPERTSSVLNNGAKTLFQARFEADLPLGAITCICDIVDKVDDNTFDLYEVKSSTKVKPDHIFDLAFQRVVLMSSGFNVRNVYVIHVNNNYERNGEVDPLALTEMVDITTEVEDKVDSTKMYIEKAFKVINSSKMPNPSPRNAKLGSFSDWMDIYQNILDEELDAYSIYKLIAPGVKRIGMLEDMGIKNINEIPDDFDLTTKQAAQVSATKNGDRIIKKDEISKFLNNLHYPIYFLDYETAMSIVPPFDGTKPYQQIPFQYSLHIVREEGGDAEHFEYLHEENSNPVLPLLKSLKKDIGPSGSVLAWHKSFEMGRNDEMGEAYPEFKDFLQDINSRTADLKDPFDKGWFADKDFFGSASIKKVLPVIAPELSYKDLEIQEGGSAQRLWMDAVIKNKDGINKEKLFKDLLEYCKLDTYSMVVIWKYLKESCK